jgi:hypothetical protein
MIVKRYNHHYKYLIVVYYNQQGRIHILISNILVCKINYKDVI